MSEEGRDGKRLAPSILGKKSTLQQEESLERRVGTHPALQSISVESQLIPLLLHPLQLQLVLLDLLLEHSVYLLHAMLQVNYYCNKDPETLLKKTSKNNNKSNHCI